MKKAFTLIELLVVVAVIAILTAVVVLVLNPAQLLRQSRDTVRLSDIQTLNAAVGTYSADLGGRPGFSLGSSSVTYVSIPDPTATSSAGTDCSGIGFPAGGSFHCSASSTYRKTDGTGWIPVNFAQTSLNSVIGSLPIDPVNQTSTNLYYSYQTDGATFKMTAAPESQQYVAKAGTNPNLFNAGENFGSYGGNWVLVPGNSTFGTGNFYVMKYEASCTRNGVALTSPTDGNAYKDNAVSSYNCKPANGLAPAALPNAIPIVDVSQVNAAAYCANIGAHLITNNEWQTIAWNAESQASNWSGGAVGSGSVYSGHNDSLPATALVADSNDANGYAGETNVGGNQKRTLTLSNGSVIWDMAGDLWEYASDTIIGTNEPANASSGFGFAWREFPALTTYGTLSQQLVGPINSSWDSTQGIGGILSSALTDPTVYVFARGGSWTTASFGGVDALYLGALTTSPYSSFGFRCAR